MASACRNGETKICLEWGFTCMGFTRKNGEGRWRSVFFFATVVIVVVSYGGQGGRGGKTPIAGAGIIKSHLRLYYGNAQAKIKVLPPRHRTAA